MQHRFQIIKKSFAVLLLVLCNCTNNKKHHAARINKEPLFKAYAVQQDYPVKVWGYIIEHNQKLVIKQFSIPAIAGDQTFKNREQAEKVGTLVADKLNRSLRPTITKTELDSLGIISIKNVLQKQ